VERFNTIRCYNLEGSLENILEKGYRDFREGFPAGKGWKSHLLMEAWRILKRG